MQCFRGYKFQLEFRTRHHNDPSDDRWCADFNFWKISSHVFLSALVPPATCVLGRRLFPYRGYTVPM